ncbi:MAG: PqqD family protein [Acidobacteriota bacterium]
MTDGPGFGINTPKVAYEAFDGEIVAVNLETGSYYSLRGTAAEFFRLAAAGASVPEITDVFAERHGADPGGVREGIAPFVDELLREGLLVPRAAGVSPAPFPPLERAPVTGPFALPRLEKFTDMQDLLLLDPIHEVDETGWPRAVPGAPAEPE